MMSFWLLGMLMTGIVLAVMLRPLIGRPVRFVRRDEFDLRIYKDQLSEIDRDRARGLLDATQVDAARLEIQRRMLKAAGDAGAPGRTVARRPAFAAVLGTFVALGAGGAYLTLGMPDLGDRPLAQRIAERRAVRIAEQDAAARRASDLVGAVARLEARLAEDPENAEGWMLLGNSRMTLRRFEAAAAAYARVVELDEGGAEPLARRAEAMIAAADGRVTGAARRLLRDVQRKRPLSPRADYYLGLGQAQDGDAQGAIETWLALLRRSPGDAPWVAMIRQRIGDLAERTGLSVARELAAASQPGATAPPALAGPTREDIAAASDMTPQERLEMIRTMVSRLAERMAENPGDLDGWLRLIRAYGVLGANEEATGAIGRALAAFDGRTGAQDRLRAAAAEFGLPAPPPPAP